MANYTGGGLPQLPADGFPRYRHADVMPPPAPGAAQLGSAPCAIHGGYFTFDPDRVPVVFIDPATGRPPDVDEAGDPCEPAEGAWARAVRKPYCPPCAAALNEAARARGRADVFDETDTAAGVTDA